MNTENLISTLDQFNAAVYLKDIHGRYLSMNRSGIQLMKRSAEGILGKTAHDLFDFKSATQMLESDQYVIDSNSVYATSFDSKDRITGTPLHIFTAKTSILSPSGKALGVIGMSIVNYKNADLFAYTCKILPQFIKHKCSSLVTELIETRTIIDFFKIHNFQ